MERSVIPILLEASIDFTAPTSPSVSKVVVVVLGLYVPPTAKVIRRRELGLNSHPQDWRSPESNSRSMVYKASSLTTTPRRLLVSVLQNI